MFKPHTLTAFRLVIAFCAFTSLLFRYQATAQLRQLALEAAEKPGYSDYQPELALYANPLEETLTLSFNAFPAGDLRVYFYNHSDLLVKVYHQPKLHAGYQAINIDISALPPDVYKLEIRTSTQLLTRKLKVE